MSTTVPIVLQCGTDYWMQFVVTDPDSGDPIAVTSPKMEIRTAGFPQPNVGGDLIYSSEGVAPGIVLTQPAAHEVLASIASATSADDLLGKRGVWDAYGTDPSGNVISLGSGTFVSSPNITKLGA